MTRLNVALAALLFLCALALVTSTHHARRLKSEFERGAELGRRIDIEWGQLQLEQSTWAKHALIETVARRQLGMRAPDPRSLQFVTPREARP
jgi:cell division protein FtsL